MTNPVYRRVVIEGLFECLSDLHIGSAAEALPDDEDAVVRAVALDCVGQPFIPGSSLRGALSALIKGANPHVHTELFGTARNSGGEDEHAGRLRVADTLLASPAQPLARRTRVAIDPVTRAAKDKHLINEYIVPRGSRFLARIQADDIGKSTLDALLASLACFDDSAAGALLGGGKTIGRGRIQWKPGPIKALSEEAFDNWLDSDQPLEKADWQSIPAPSAPAASARPLHWRLRVHFDEPVLIKDPEYEPVKGEADLRYLREQGKLLITGASLKGLFRARARRIMLTISGNETATDGLIGQMFGSEDGISRWFMNDLLAEVEEIHEQTLIAIDRFTGGVKNSAMLNLEAARVADAETTVVAHHPPGWQKLIALWCLRDAMEGDLNLGWGAARGFGAFWVKLLDKNGNAFDWQALLNTLADKPALARWQKGLLDVIEKAQKAKDEPAPEEEEAP